MKVVLNVFLLFSLLVPAYSFAFKADPLKGKYKILQQSVPGTDGLFILDTNTLAVIWSKYAETPLPPDLLPYKDQGAVIAGFTNRRLVILSLEANVVVGNEYLRMAGDNTQIEMGRQGGQFALFVTENGRVSRYLLDGSPTPP